MQRADEALHVSSHLFQSKDHCSSQGHRAIQIKRYIGADHRSLSAEPRHVKSPVDHLADKAAKEAADFRRQLGRPAPSACMKLLQRLCHGIEQLQVCDVGALSLYGLHQTAKSQ